MNFPDAVGVTKNRWAWAILTVSAILLLTRCGPSSRMRTEATGERRPTIVRARPVDLELCPGDGKMVVQWRVAGSETMSGYDIFLADHPVTPTETVQPVSSVKPFNTDVYPGDTNPDDSVEHFPAEDLQNGVKYYVWVRIVRPDGTLSEPSKVLTAVCGPRGEFDLGIRYQSDNDGYSLEKRKSVRADASDNDLYYFSKDGLNFLASPARLNAYLRSTKLAALSFRGELDLLRKQLRTLKDSTWADRIAIAEGAWLHLVTAEGADALIHIISIKAKEVRLAYALCPLAGELSF